MRSRIDFQERHRQAAEQEDGLSKKLRPQDQDAERAALGSVLIFSDTLPEVKPIISPEMFYCDAHAKILAAMLSLEEAGVPIDALTLSDELAKRDQLEEIGGDSYLLRVLSSVPHTAHAKYYADIVRKKHILRRVIYACTNAAFLANQDETEPAIVIQTLADEVAEISALQVTEHAKGLKPAVLAMLNAFETGKPPGQSIGFADVDRLTHGLRASQLIVLAARPATGKTAYAANIAWNVSRYAKVLFISLEQSTEELAERWVASRLKRSIHSLAEMAHGDDCDRQTLLDAMSEVSDRNIVVDDRPGRTVSDIAAICRTHSRKTNFGLVIIDYLQLIQSEDRKANREVQVSGISRALKELAKSIGAPVIALAQLNRAIESRDDKRPRLADLRESGAIEQDADMVWFLDRPAVWDKSADPTQASLFVAKHRNGKCGEIPLFWDAESMTFRNAMKREAIEFDDPYGSTDGE